MTGTAIETERLVLRPTEPQDAEGAAEMLGDPEVMRFLGGQTVPAEDVPAVIERWISRWDENGCGPFSILRREDGRWLGRVGLIVWDVRTWTNGSFASAGEHAQVELGWSLSRPYWGHGYMTEAALAARRWAYDDFGFAGRLISVIEPTNLRSQGVARRLGCTPCETVVLAEGGPHVTWEHPR